MRIFFRCSVHSFATASFFFFVAGNFCAAQSSGETGHAPPPISPTSSNQRSGVSREPTGGPKIDDLRKAANQLRVQRSYKAAAKTFDQLGYVLIEQQSYKRAEDAYRKAIDADSLAFDTDVLRDARRLRQIGFTQVRRSDFRSAVVSYENAVKLLRGSDASKSLAFTGSLLLLARSNLDLGRPVPAREQAEEARRLIVGLGESKAKGARAWLISARAHRVCGDTKRAGELVAEGVQSLVDAGTKPENNALHAEFVLEAAMCLNAEEGGRPAEYHYRQYIRIAKNGWGPRSVEHAIGLSELAQHYQDRGFLDTAVEFAEHSVRVAQALNPLRKTTLATCQSTLGSIYVKLGRLDDAEKLLSGARKVQADAVSTQSLDYAETLVSLSELHVARGKLSEGERLLAEAIKIQENAIGKYNYLLRTVLSQHADLLKKMNKNTEAQGINARIRGLRISVAKKNEESARN